MRKLKIEEVGLIAGGAFCHCLSIDAGSNGKENSYDIRDSASCLNSCCIDKKGVLWQYGLEYGRNWTHVPWQKCPELTEKQRSYVLTVFPNLDSVQRVSHL